MSETMAESGSLDLEPEAWKYKTDSDYSVTEGMEYEVFTKEFREIYESLYRQEVWKRTLLQNNVFVDNTGILQEEEEIRQYLFQETKREGKQKKENQNYSINEVLLGVGVLILLFLLLVRFTFKKRKKQGGGKYNSGRIYTGYRQV